MPSCPDDGALLGSLEEGDGPSGVRIHVVGCPSCRSRLDELRGLIGSFRRLVPADRRSHVAAPARPYHPAVLGKFFVLRVRRDQPGEPVVSYCGVHRHVHKSAVILHLARAVSAGEETVAVACKLLTRLNHPRIARAIDVGSWEDHPFLAVEDAPGLGLDEAIKARSFTLQEAAAMVAELARGLASAHREGLAHGALSASSIAVDAQGRPTLIDFGVAHLSGHGPDGSNADDRARDLAALGEILGLLLAGNPIPKGLESARARALAVDPILRYADAEEFARGSGAIYEIASPTPPGRRYGGANLVDRRSLVCLVELSLSDGFRTSRSIRSLDPAEPHATARSRSVRGLCSLSDKGDGGKRMAIWFYSKSPDYGWLSNFSAHPFVLDGISWPTVEHYYQAQKYPGQAVADAIHRSGSPAEARSRGQARSMKPRADWEVVKTEVMRRAVEAKFAQHDSLRERLLATGDEELIHESSTDFYWGRKREGAGGNQLGLILMQVRGELQGHAYVPQNVR